jgi:hypothetical protein
VALERRLKLRSMQSTIAHGGPRVARDPRAGIALCVSATLGLRLPVYQPHIAKGGELP